MKLHNLLFLSALFACTIINSQPFTKISPSGGPVVELLTDPTNSQISFAIVKKHGLFKRNLTSSDEWTHIVKEKVYDIEKDKSGNIYYASESGLYKFGSELSSWQNIFNKPVYHVMCRMDSLVIIDTTNLSGYQNNFSPYLFSNNNGHSWTEWMTTASRRVGSPWPTDAWAKRGSFLITEGGYILRAQERKIFRGHLDSMDVWEELNFFDPVWATPQMKFLPILESGVVYAYSRYVDLHPAGYEKGGLFKSTNFGDSWESIAEFRDVSCVYINNKYIYVGDPEGKVYRIFIASDSVEQIADFGGEVTSISFSGALLLASTIGNIFASGDDGVNWVPSDKGINFPFVTALEIVNNNNDKRFIAAIRNSGIWISDDLGSSWELTESNIEIVPGLLKASGNGEIVYAAGSNIYASTDKGITWIKCPDLPVAYYGWYGRTNDFEIDPINPYQIYITYEDHSLDHYRGNFFIRLNFDPAKNEWSSKLIDPDWEIFGQMQGLQYSAGNFWASSYKNKTTLLQIYGTPDPLKIEGSVSTPDSVFANLWTVKDNTIVLYNDYPSNNHWASFDLGATWNSFEIENFQRYRYDDYNILVTIGEFEILDDNSIYYVSPGNGILYSNDLCMSWINLTNDYATSNFFEMKFYGAENKYFIAASDDGLYTGERIVSLDTDKQVNASPNEFHLYQNYPNPFNPTTTIKYSISANEAETQRAVSLRIYDILGNEILTLLNEKKAPGIYEFEFDGSDLASGIYFYKLSEGNYFDTKKMLILK